MAVRGYNFQVDGVRHNLVLQPTLDYTFTGLNTQTSYNLTYTAVDMAGNESAPSTILPVTTLSNDPPPVSNDPLPLVDRQWIDAKVAERKKSDGLSLQITGPRGYYTQVYGQGTTKPSKAMNIDNHTRMGSISKLFPTYAFWKQVDLGTMSLDDTLSTYVPGVPNGDVITIANLLQMRSGIFYYEKKVGPTTVTTPTAKFSVDDAVALIKAGPPENPPGVNWHYTNGSTILLGKCLESVTGRTIRQIIKEDVIDPLGLTETSFPENTDFDIPAPYTDGYQANPIAAAIGLIVMQKITRENVDLFGGCAGGIISTSNDLTKMAFALRDGTGLSPESHNLWTTFFDGLPWPGQPLPEFGHGYHMFAFGTWVGHDGSNPGYDGACFFEKNSGATYVCLENRQTPGVVAVNPLMIEIGEYLYPGSMQPTSYDPRAAIAGQFGRLSGSITGRIPARGSIAGQLRSLSGGFTAFKTVPGQATGSVAGSFRRLSGAVTAQQKQRGSIAGTFKSLRGNLSTSSIGAPKFRSMDSAETNTMTIPTHAVGDLIILYVTNNNSSAPPILPAAGGTVPAWTDVPDTNHTGMLALSTRMVRFVATATNHTSGVFTGGTSMMAVVVRMQNTTTPIGDSEEQHGNASSQAIAPALFLNSGGKSLLMHFFSVRNAALWGAAPLGYTSRLISDRCIMLTKDDTTSDGSVTMGVTGNSGSQYSGTSVEVLAQ